MQKTCLHILFFKLSAHLFLKVHKSKHLAWSLSTQTHVHKHKTFTLTNSSSFTYIYYHSQEKKTVHIKSQSPLLLSYFLQVAFKKWISWEEYESSLLQHHRSHTPKPVLHFERLHPFTKPTQLLIKVKHRQH